jgi:hypothetical protein
MAPQSARPSGRTTDEPKNGFRFLPDWRKDTTYSIACSPAFSLPRSADFLHEMLFLMIWLFRQQMVIADRPYFITDSIPKKNFPIYMPHVPFWGGNRTIVGSIYSIGNGLVASSRRDKYCCQEITPEKQGIFKFLIEMTLRCNGLTATENLPKLTLTQFSIHHHSFYSITKQDIHACG